MLLAVLILTLREHRMLVKMLNDGHLQDHIC